MTISEVKIYLKNHVYVYLVTYFTSLCTWAVLIWAWIFTFCIHYNCLLLDNHWSVRTFWKNNFSEKMKIKINIDLIFNLNFKLIICYYLSVSLIYFGSFDRVRIDWTIKWFINVILSNVKMMKIWAKSYEINVIIEWIYFLALNAIKQE